MDYNQLGARVREKRQRLGLTQEQLAELCNISPSYIGIIERGDKKLSVETLVKLSRILGVSTDFLLRDSLLKAIPEVKANEILSAISNLNETDVNMIIDIVKTIAIYKVKT